MAASAGKAIAELHGVGLAAARAEALGRIWAYSRQQHEHQREVLHEHGEWLELRYADDHVVFAGRCYDGPFGLVVLDAENEEEARRLMEQAPSIRAGAQRADLYPVRTFLAREYGPQG